MNSISRFVPITSDLIWGQLDYFNKYEAWGDASKMDVRLLYLLDKIRNDLQRKITINCGYTQTGHSSKSYHKLGMAVDISIENPTDEPNYLWDAYLYILANWYGGVGVYPFWNTPGLHLDIGPDHRTWVRDKEGIYIYDSSEIKDIVIKPIREAV